MRPRTLFSTVAVLSAVACGGSSSKSINGPNPSSAPMSATIDGAAWSSALPQAIYNGSILSVAGLNTALTTSVSFAIATTAPGTYSVALGNVIGGNAIVVEGSKGWGSALAGGTGSVTLTTLTTHHVVGTFAFDAVPASGGATGTVHVTNGRFDVTF